MAARRRWTRSSAMARPLSPEDVARIVPGHGWEVYQPGAKHRVRFTSAEGHFPSRAGAALVVDGKLQSPVLYVCRDECIACARDGRALAQAAIGQRHVEMDIRFRELRKRDELGVSLQWLGH